MMRWDMDDALAVPEIVEAVLAKLELTRFLYPCLLVNQLFFHEAARLLWSKCGAAYSHDEYLCRTLWHQDRCRPAVWHLARLALESPQRGQYYANFIRELSFSIDHKEYKDAQKLLDTESKAEVRWHPALQTLDFPVLEKLEVRRLLKTGDCLLNQASYLKHYCRPTLRSFIGGSIPNDSQDLLRTLRTNCPNLKAFRLNPAPTTNTLSTFTHDLYDFLKDFPFLSNVSLSTSFQNAQSDSMFQLLSTNKNLATLLIPNIQDDWVDFPTNKEAFCKLSELQTYISTNGLQRLAPHIYGLRKLSLSDILPTQNILTVVSSLHNLTILYVHFHASSTINESDIVQLSRGCLTLEDLRLYGDTGDQSGTASIKDSTIAELGRNLSDLRFLHIELQPSSLTEQSALELGTFCPKLQLLNLTADFHFQHLTAHSKAVTFPNLKSLGVDFVGAHPQRVQRVPNTVKGILEMMPLLESINNSNHRDGDPNNDGDWILDKALAKALEKRNRQHGIPKAPPYQLLQTNHRVW